MPQPSWRVRLRQGYGGQVALLVACIAAAAGCGGNGRFNVQNARAHVERLSGAIGARPAGSAENEKARAYLIETLQLFGFEVRVQEADATWPEAGVTTRVANVIAVRQGQQREAVALVAHYDSVPYGPGAGDDAFGTAVVLEAARVLAARSSPRHSLMVAFTDGEEHGLMGARALVQDPEIRVRLKTFVNLESIGSDGPVVLFETGPGTSPTLQAWARARRPRGGSYMQSIYDALPNDTDFTLLKTLPGASGINLAAVGDGYSYHTDRDRADRLTSRALGRTGELVLDIVDDLDTRTSLEPSAVPSMYFSVLDRWAFVMSMGTGVAIGGITTVLATILWLFLGRRLFRQGGAFRLLMTLAWAVIASGAVLAALTSAVWMMRVARAQLHPWYAWPARLFVFMTVMAIAVSWVIRRFATVVPPRLQPAGTPFGVWFATLPVWVLVAIAALLYAPAASYLVWMPLAVATLLLPLGFWQPAAARASSVAVLLATWALWVPDLVTLLGFSVTTLERLPVVTPTWVYPALFFAAGLVIWPPALAVLVGRPRWRMRHGLAGALLMVALVVSGIIAVTGRAYTPERPLQRTAMFVDDRVRGRAQWELTSNEPGVDIGAGAPPNVQWHRVQGANQTASVGARPKAYVFTGAVPVATTPLPFVVSSTIVRRPEDADLEITVTPADAEPRAVAFVLPEAIVPTRTTLVGRTRSGRWQAWSTTLPVGGLTWRATVPASQVQRLAATEVWVTSTRLPGHTPDSPLPAWLQTPHTTWQTRYAFVVGITPNDVAQPSSPELGTSRYVPTAMGKVHVFERGQGPRALLFLHGWGGAATLWREQLPLTEGLRALFVDLPGHGRSEAPDVSYDVASHATAMRAVLDAAGVQQAVVVGHNVGALIGWHLAAKDPSRIVGLVSLDGTLVPPPQRNPESEAYLAGLQPSGYEALVAASLPTLFTPATPQAVRDEVSGHVRRTPPRAIATLLRDLGAGSPFAAGPYAGPVLAISARTSQAAAGTSKGSVESQLRTRFPQLDYRVFDAGHFLMLERPREVNDAIAGFLLGRGLLR